MLKSQSIIPAIISDKGLSVRPTICADAGAAKAAKKPIIAIKMISFDKLAVLRNIFFLNPNVKWLKNHKSQFRQMADKSQQPNHKQFPNHKLQTNSNLQFTNHLCFNVLCFVCILSRVLGIVICVFSHLCFVCNLWFGICNLII